MVKSRREWGGCFAEVGRGRPTFFIPKFLGLETVIDMLVEKVKGIAEPILALLGLSWVDAAYGRSRQGGQLKITIDRVPGGVTLEDCAQVSRFVGRALDANEVIPDRYRLEVSSPGLDRRLVSREDFVRFVGRKVRVKTRRPIDDQKVFIGHLSKFADDTLYLQIDPQEMRPVAWADVAEARLEVTF